MIIDGKAIAEGIIQRLGEKPAPKKFFAAFLIGDDAASESFLRQKGKTAERLGIDFRLYKLDGDLSNDAAREAVHKVVDGSRCGGAIVQLPLPEHLNRHYVLNAIPREKDCDVLSERSLGAFYAGRNSVLPPVAATVQEILEQTGFELKGKKVAIIGTGLLIGRPIAVWLMNQVREFYVLHKGSDLSLLKEADLIITGTGVSGLFSGAMLKPGAGVIDFGYGFNNGKTSGDFDPADAPESAFYTPTPGGTGPILVAKLFENFYRLNP